MLSPSVVVLLAWMLIPLAMTLWFSAERYNLLDPWLKAFAGLSNYADLITHRALWIAMGNTLFLVGMVLGATLVFGSSRVIALAFGADCVVGPKQMEEEASSRGGFDAVIDAFGSATTFECAIASSARGAKILVFGVATISAVSNIRPYDIYARELTVIGSSIGPTHTSAPSAFCHTLVWIGSRSTLFRFSTSDRLSTLSPEAPLPRLNSCPSVTFGGVEHGTLSIY